jgi:nicotinamide mononucleotide transporter
VKAHIANFPVGLANDAFFLLLFLAAGLYADSGLQVVYFAFGAVGWWQWLHGGANRTRLETTRASARELLVLAALVAAATWGLTVLLERVDDIAPFWDALTTALSLAAQWLLNTRRIQNWYFWIAADVVYVPLYGVKHLWLTGVVYALFLVLCFRGLHEWRAVLPAKPLSRRDRIEPRLAEAG